jgi:NTP pyrophosphatase (non-canonical NTP hydrolase)|tara:strand:- start:1800 stop:2213 length:414 start_codon:yes stop_codon:yes gene_type:complete
MSKQIDLNKYKEFVDAVTSDESKNNDNFTNRWVTLVNQRDVDMPRLLTASMGLGAESGEFTEVVKKILFQGKPLDADNIFHMQRELGDIMWYWMQGCMALNIDPNEVIQMNIDKLKARYPGGDFDAHYSENRQDGDV